MREGAVSFGCEDFSMLDVIFQNHSLDVLIHGFSSSGANHDSFLSWQRRG